MSNQKNTNLKTTWGDLKALCENSGMQDSDYIDVVDISWGTSEQLKCVKDADFGWQITMKPCGEG